jgi:3-phosphoshikimate 1-carboxyvinyltransferase
MNPGRNGIVEVLERMGAPITVSEWATKGNEPVATLAVQSTELVGTAVGGELVPRTIDELVLVAVLGSHARGRTAIRDAAELRVKESDRIAAIVGGLGLMGARIEERPDGLVVEGPTPLRGARVDGHGDHRIVMALAVAGLAAEDETVVTGADRAADSFPGFRDALAALGARIERQSST